MNPPSCTKNPTLLLLTVLTETEAMDPVPTTCTPASKLLSNLLPVIIIMPFWYTPAPVCPFSRALEFVTCTVLFSPRLTKPANVFRVTEQAEAITNPPCCRCVLMFLCLHLHAYMCIRI